MSRVDKLRAEVWPRYLLLMGAAAIDTDCMRMILAAVIELTARDLAAEIVQLLRAKSLREGILIYNYDAILLNLGIVPARRKHTRIMNLYSGEFVVMHNDHIKCIEFKYLDEIAANYVRAIDYKSGKYKVYM